MQTQFKDLTAEQQLIYLLRSAAIELIYTKSNSAKFDILLPYLNLPIAVYDILIDLHVQANIIWHHRSQEMQEMGAFMHIIYIHTPFELGKN